MNDAIFAHAFSLIPSLSTKTLAAIAQKFPSFEAAFKADQKKLAQIGVPKPSIQKITTLLPKINLQTEAEKLKRYEIKLLSYHHRDYPKTLKQIFDPPHLLYYRGNPKILAQPAIAIVGTRRASQYGLKQTKKIAQALARAGLNIVSGLALGIDAAAHHGALEADGLTTAVLGSGSNNANICPYSNYQLAQTIIQKGVLISEFPPGTHPAKFTFPRRNRIISGLSHGTIVIEAPGKSGALITADFAAEHGREVMALPGQVGQLNSEGPNQLIKDGAHLITSAKDVLSVFDIAPKDCQGQLIQPLPKLSSHEAKICALLAPEPLHINQIAAITKLPIPQISTILAQLELKQVLTQERQVYRLKTEFASHFSRA